MSENWARGQIYNDLWPVDNGLGGWPWTWQEQDWKTGEKVCMEKKHVNGPLGIDEDLKIISVLSEWPPKGIHPRGNFQSSE